MSTLSFRMVVSPIGVAHDLSMLSLPSAQLINGVND